MSQSHHSASRPSWLLLFPVLLLFLIPSLSTGYGFHDATKYGDPIETISVRAAAMVGIRVFGSNGSNALFLNPAAMSEIDVLNISTSVSSLNWTEEVVDSSATDAIKRSDNGLGSLSGAVAFRVSPDLVFGAGCARVSDFSYDGSHFLPEDPSHPGIDIVEQLVSEGSLWEALGGVSYEITGNWSAGASAGMRFGEATYDYSYDEKFTPELDSTSTWSWDLSEFCYHGGITVTDEIFGAGVCYTSGSKDRYYSRLSFAGKAMAEHIGNTTIGFEGELISPFEDNYFNGKLSIETPIRGGFNLLAGVGFREGSNMNRVGTMFSVGGNYTGERFRVDIAVFNSSRSRRSTSFPNEYSSHVDDSWTQFCLGLQYLI